MVDPDKCSGCNLCGMYCPDFAIFGFKQAEVKTAKPAGEPVLEAKEA